MDKNEPDPEIDTLCLIYHDDITVEKTKTLMGMCTQAVAQYKVKTIYFEFSSSGGSVDSAITLYNFLKSLPCEIVMHNIGSIDSAANVVFMAGDKRYASPHTSFLFHGVAWGFNETVVRKSQIKETISNIERAEEKIAGILADNTKLSQEEIRSLFNEGETKSATFAKSKGIVSELKDVQVPEGTPFITVDSNS